MANETRKEGDAGSRTQETSHLVFTGGLVRDANRRTRQESTGTGDVGIRSSKMQTAVVATKKAQNVANYDDTSWRNTAMMSMDGLLIPISTQFSVDSEFGQSADLNSPETISTFELPHSKMAMRRNPDTGNEELKKVVVSPYWHIGSGEVTSATLNPFARGHHVAMLARNNTTTNPSVAGAGYAEETPSLGGASTLGGGTSRPLGLRGPLVLSGWGYDPMGLPVPNAKLDASSKEDDWKQSNFGRPPREENPHDKPHLHFKKGFMKKLDEWKTGPVDLRWNRDRKVWQAAPSENVYLCKATRCILPKAGPDGRNSFDFSSGGSINSPGRLYRNPCPERSCSPNMYFPKSILYSDIEIYDPEEYNWSCGCEVKDEENVDTKITTVRVECSDMSERCVPFYDAVILRSVAHRVAGGARSDCGDKFYKSGSNPLARRAGNPCHGWGSTYQTFNESVNERVGRTLEYSESAKATLYQKIFIENPLNQGLMLGDSFLSYDTGRKVVFTYTRTDKPSCSSVSNGTPITVKEIIPVHVILQAEFYGLELVTKSGCEQGEVTSCTKKIFAQGMSTMEDCGPDDDYPLTVVR